VLSPLHVRAARFAASNQREQETTATIRNGL
jgi:hypothetical protein